MVLIVLLRVLCCVRDKRDGVDSSDESCAV